MTDGSVPAAAAPTPAASVSGNGVPTLAAPQPTFGRLELVRVRDYWASEERDFTPWLAQAENLSLLGETVGLTLQLQRRLAGLRASDRATRDDLGELRLHVEALLAESRRHETLAKPVQPPCLFNTGCCSFGDGDITGLEIASEEIRLVRWAAADDEGETGSKNRWRPPRRVALEHAPLRRVFDEVGH